MKKHKNTILILISIVLFVYAGLMSIYPAILTNKFDESEFGKKVEEVTGLVTTVDTVRFHVTPTLKLVMYIVDWSSKYIDAQDCFDARYMEIKVNLFDVFTKKFTLKNMLVKNAVFSNQVLPDKKNKLFNLPKSVNGSAFGGKDIKVRIDGPVHVQNFKIKEIAPKYYNEKIRDDVTYSQADVLAFLKLLNFTRVSIE